MNFEPWYQARELVCRALERDMLGGPDDEKISERPLDRFLLGILYPEVESGAAVSVESQDTREVDEGADDTSGDTVADPAVALSRVRYPSSMGMTFSVRSGDTERLEVVVQAARYVPQESEHLVDGPRSRLGSSMSTSWTRTSTSERVIAVDVGRTGTSHEVVAEGLEVMIVVRPALAGVQAVTVVLRNLLTAPSGERDRFCWFQPSLVVRCVGGSFVDRRTARRPAVEDEDIESYELIYRDVHNVAVGHGCAVVWDPVEPIHELRTTFLPRHDLRLSEATAVAGADLDMEGLTKPGAGELLSTLLRKYESWIVEQEEDAQTLDDSLRPTADRHLTTARNALYRMRRGLALVKTDEKASQAFRLMNRVMLEQRRRQDSIRAGHVGDPATSEPQSWRPFQIAFILLNVEGLSDADHPDREVADLLWFPTGGGKTEAYLGLIAYTILLRRLRDPADGGVSVMMRYTLRLLTLQQFERASGLICALESLRRRELPEATPISVGLWVGQAATPNTCEEAGVALRKLSRDVPVEEKNPVQILRCPWCGSQLAPTNYRVPADNSAMTVSCPRTSCEFSNGLPVHIVDQDVYRVRPSLVIATVDKFAMIAWRAEVGFLFSSDGRYSRPDLIVQDELHLISGPLGTMVGLYETAVDAAATGLGRPKVVASTATIRRAGSQIRAVFDRVASQFPPSGIDATNSFFTKEASPEKMGTRRYLGIMAPGSSHATLLVRTYAALLEAALSLPEDDDVRDAYWTIVGYFNSLRVLGSAYLQVLDDVPDRIKVVAEREGMPRREIGEPHELTSRRKSSEIPVELKALGTSYPDPDAPDVVLATNMISVGVDVDRLGLMVVMGQPQATAEYIQATSRVGRKYPGLVVTLYNAARSRDLSHYENFTTYHRTLYRQVEATSATPFAPRARDRGLHGVLVGLIRLTLEAARADNAARSVADWSQELEDAADLIVARAERVTGEPADAVRAQLEELLTNWEDEADNAGTALVYPGWYGRRPALLVDTQTAAKDPEFTFPPTEPPWPTLTSLREVDAESGLYVVPTRRRF